LPSTLSAGDHVLYVKVVESSNDNSMASTRTSLVSQIVVTVPYDGVFVDAQLIVDQSKVTEPTKFTISLFGKGNVPAMCYASIDIKGPTNDLITTIMTNKKMLKKAEASKLEVEWKGDKNKGLYLAEANVYCADKIQVLREQFYVGNPTVSVLSIEANEFELGLIIPVTLTLKNNWNRDFEDVYAEAIVLDKNGNIIQEFKSATESINAEGIDEVTAYWETKNLLVGLYDLSITTYFEGKSHQEMFKANVALDSLKINKLTGNVLSGVGNNGDTIMSNEVGMSSQMSVLILLVLILIVVNVGLVFYLKSKKK